MDVNESMLQSVAKDIVDDYTRNGVSLADGVRKKASDLGFNKEQTARLIEKANADTFISVFPTKTDFEVADPNDILTEKVASVIREAATMSYTKSMGRSFDQILGIESEKLASVEAVSKPEYGLAVKLANKLVEDNDRLIKLAEELKLEDANKVAFVTFKDNVLMGTPVYQLEYDLYRSYPEKLAFAVALVDDYVEKIASDTSVSIDLLDRLDTSTDLGECDGLYGVGYAFKDIMGYA